MPKKRSTLFGRDQRLKTKNNGDPGTAEESQKD